MVLRYDRLRSASTKAFVNVSTLRGTPPWKPSNESGRASDPRAQLRARRQPTGAPAQGNIDGHRSPLITYDGCRSGTGTEVTGDIPSGPRSPLVDTHRSQRVNMTHASPITTNQFQTPPGGAHLMT